MTDDQEAALITARILCRDWHLINATMDNTVSVEAETGDLDGVMAIAQEIRSLGEEQVVVAGPNGGTWPPSDAPVEIRFSRSQWGFIAAMLARWGSLEEDEADRAQMSELQGRLPT